MRMAETERDVRVTRWAVKFLLTGFFGGLLATRESSKETPDG